MRRKVVIVSDSKQQGYRYELVEPRGKNDDPDFKPELTPKQMLRLGVFGGYYLTDGQKEFPKDWFSRAKLSPEHHDDTLNFFSGPCLTAARGLGRDRACRPRQRQALLHWAYDSRKL